MNNLNSLKDKLIDELWVPISIRAGDILFPRNKKNKKMKLLTLTSDDNFNEIVQLVDKKITQNRLTVAWNHDFIKKIRLESEGIACKILGPRKYEDSISSSPVEVLVEFPFDIINLDFSSQEPELENGRIEKEVLSLENTIKLQKEKNQDKKGFLMIYTTILNSKEINCRELISNSNNIRIDGWSGCLCFDSLSNNPSNHEDKIKIIEMIFTQLSSKYNFDLELENNVIKLQDLNKCMLSIAGIIKYK
jgi:hypothetical protein